MRRQRSICCTNTFSHAISAVLFVSGETPEELQRNIAERTGPLVMNLPEYTVGDQQVRVAAALHWLEQNPGWFLIVDNLDTRESVSAAERLLTRLAGGQVVLTSRLGDFSGGIKSLALDVLSEADARDFLMDRTEGRRQTTQSDSADAMKLGCELGGLALALEQAGAYIRQRRKSFAEYLGAWQSHDKKVQAWHKPELMHYPRSVAKTWSTTMQQLRHGEIALLRLFSFFAPDPIPQTALETEEAESVWQQSVALLPADSQKEDSGEIFQSLATLADFSMVNWDADEQNITVHRVVQEIVRTQIEESSETTTWLQASLNLINKATPTDCYDVRTWPVLQPLANHLESLLSFSQNCNITEPVPRLCSILGGLFQGQALFSEAEPLMRRALSIDEASLGIDHPNSVTVRKNYAILKDEIDEGPL